MKAILMHKDIEVAVIDYDDGEIVSLDEVLCSEHMPTPIGACSSDVPKPFIEVYLRAWQRNRMVPGDRSNLGTNFSSRDIIHWSDISHCMSLTDQYWIKKQKEEIRWNEISFRKNGFKESMITLMGCGERVPSPDYNTDGCLPKSWMMQDGIPLLIKDAPVWLPTASANEVVASKLAQLCGVDHATYNPIMINDKCYCASTCFIENDEEFFVPISKYRIVNLRSIEKVMTDLFSEDFMQTMTAFDLLVGNTDRHLGNFGLIFNTDDMSLIRPAPLFDSGVCLHDWLTQNDLFKPLFSTRESALAALPKVPFHIPDDDTLYSVVQNVYNEFGFHDDIDTVSTELIGNARQLRNIQRT